ncbi:MAG: hypothetical protein AB7G15_14325 [Alphaproteobacteria bacterium]
MKKGLVFGLIGVLIVLVVGYFGAQAYVDGNARRQADALVKSLPGDVKVTYGSVATSLLSQTAVVREVNIDAGGQGKYKIARIDVTRVDLRHKQPHYVDVSFRGLEVPTDRLSRELKDVLARMGYAERLVLNVDYGYEYDEAKRTLTVRQIKIDGPDLGTLTLTLVIGGVASLDFGDARVRALAPLTLEVLGASLVFKDNSLTRRALRAFAAQQNLNEDSAKLRLFRDIDREEAKTKDELTREALRELKKFIDKPGEFIVTAKPTPPFKLGEIFAITDFKRRLGIVVAAR